MYTDLDVSVTITSGGNEGGTMQILSKVIRGDGIVSLETVEYGRQIWIRTSKRGSSKYCAVCGGPLEGRLSYRPSGSPINRGDRICVGHVESENITN